MSNAKVLIKATLMTSLSMVIIFSVVSSHNLASVIGQVLEYLP